MDCKLDGKVAVITGGARGIGYAAATALANEGATVVVGDLGFTPHVLEKFVTIGQESIYAGYLDVTNEKAVQNFFQLIVKKFHTIDIFYSNAGICQNGKPFEEVNQHEWDKMYAVNTFGGISCLRQVVPIMKMQRSGKIILSGSIAAEVGGIRTVASYAASKASNISIMMSLAKELGPYGINVNAVSPGIIETPMTEALSPVDADTILLKRFGTGTDMGNIILFLSCHMSDYLTGVVIDVNGGQYFR